MATKKEREVEIEYPAPYEYIEGIVKPFRDDIWRLEDEIEKLDLLPSRQPTRPVLSLTPGGMKSVPVEKYVDRTVLEREKDKYWLQLRQQVEREIQHATPEEQKGVREAVWDDVDRNSFLLKTKEELQEIRKEERDMSVSQNYTDILLKRSRETGGQNVKQEKEASTLTSPSVPASERFGKTLTFLQHKENAKDMTDQTAPALKKEIGDRER